MPRLWGKSRTPANPFGPALALTVCMWKTLLPSAARGSLISSIAAKVIRRAEVPLATVRSPTREERVAEGETAG